MGIIKGNRSFNYFKLILCRGNYEKYWEDISPFIKYGCLRDEKFCDRMNDYILFKDLEDKFITLPDLLVTEDTKGSDEAEKDIENKDSVENSSKETASDPKEQEDKRKSVYYVTDKVKQGQYINQFKSQGLSAVILDSPIDTSFITQLESRNENYKFERIDSKLNDDLLEETNEDLQSSTDDLTETFRSALENEELKVEVKKLKDDSVSSMLTISESSRRMADMMKMYAMPGMDMGMMGRDETLVLNIGNSLVQFILNNKDSKHTKDFCNQLYDLALLANEPLSPEKMETFIKRSNKIMLLLSK